MDIDQLPSTTTKHIATKRYMGMVTLITSLVVVSSFLGFTFRTNALFDTLLLEEARAFSREVMIVRQWVREHGGIYVRQGDNKGKSKRIIVAQDGEVLQHRNTAEVTQELSRLSHQSGIIRFGSTTLSPLNPVNKPDAFERSGLEKLLNGAKEVYSFNTIDGELVFRYMSPLITHKKCLNCHTDGSFQDGRVDSGLTFLIPASEIENEKQLNKILMALSGISVIVLVSLSIRLLARRFIRQLAEADRQLERMASEDVLTRLFNRRMGMELLKTELARCQRQSHPLSLALLDIDYFKRINDKMGHQAGDEGLRALADVIRHQLREYDTAFRYGGEEFILILSDTNASQAMTVSERMRLAVEVHEVTTSNNESLTFTISVGVAQFQKGMDLDTFIAHADEALYLAKEGGRNRCILYTNKS